MALAHSYKNPTVRRATTAAKNTLSVIEEKAVSFKKGNNKINSTSKIKKIRVTRKNWREKIDVFQKLGKKPHSKGLNFSLSQKVFANNSEKATITSPAIKALSPTRLINITINNG